METILGIDFGGTRTKIGFGSQKQCSAKSYADQDHPTLLRFLKKTLDRCPGCKAIGISLACTLFSQKSPDSGNFARYISSDSSKFSRLSLFHDGEVERIEEDWGGRLGLPISILNDGEAAAIAEHKCGAGRGHRHLLVITLGTSIGVGFVFHGRLLIGPYSSRASHLLLDPSGKECPKGHRGCWKSMISKEALCNSAQEIGLPGHPLKIFQMARRGNPDALLCYSMYAEKVAYGIAGIVGCVPVECVVIGGGISKAGKVLFSPLIDRFRKGDILDKAVADGIEIKQAECSEAPLLGIRRYALSRIKRSR